MLMKYCYMCNFNTASIDVYVTSYYQHCLYLVLITNHFKVMFELLIYIDIDINIAIAVYLTACAWGFQHYRPTR